VVRDDGVVMVVQPQRPCAAYQGHGKREWRHEA